jgi:hypothetical protein
VQQQQRQKPAAGRHSVQQQQQSGAMQQAANVGGSAAAAGAAVMPAVGPLAVPVGSAQASTLDSSNGTGSIASSAWPGNSANDEAFSAEADELVLQAGAYSHAQGMVARQGASVLLQKQRKSKRQLVAAAQSAAHASKGSCSSGSGSAA